MRVVDQFQSQYLLKVAGSDQYFLQNCQISQYKYIRQCLAKSETPHLMLMSKVQFTASLSAVFRSQKRTKLLHTSGACPGDGSYYY